MLEQEGLPGVPRAKGGVMYTWTVEEFELKRADDRIRELEAALAKAEDDRDRARADAELLALGLEKAEAERDGSITVLRTWQEIANRLQQERDEAVELLRWTRDHNDWTNKDYREWLRGRDSLLSRIDARKGAKGGDSG